MFDFFGYNETEATDTIGGMDMPTTVLIIEDDPNIADLLHLYLEKEGYHTAIAPDG